MTSASQRRIDNRKDFLNLVQKNIAFFFSCAEFSDMLAESNRIAEQDVPVIVKLKNQNIVFVHRTFKQVCLVYFFEEVGFSAPPDSRNHLGKAVVAVID